MEDKKQPIDQNKLSNDFIAGLYDEKNSNPLTLDNVRNNPWKTILIYLVFGFSWIIFSDNVLNFFIRDHDTYLAFQTYKGWLYVSITAILLYFVIRYENLRIFSLSRSLSDKNQELLTFSEEMIAIEDELKSKIDELNLSMYTLEKHKTFIEEIYNNSNTLILLWNKEGNVIDVNNFFIELTGYDKSEVVGQKFEQYIHEEEQFSMSKFLALLESHTFVQNLENRIVTKSGNCLNVLWNNKLIKDPNSEEMFIASFGIDVTLDREKEKQISRLAYTDKLTGLKNKVVFESEVSYLIQKKTYFTLIYLDFDNFKNLNDVLGHDRGDEFLLEYSVKIKEIIPDATIYRWSGDEFLIVLNTDELDEIQSTIDRLMTFTKRKWSVGDMEYYPSISMGVTRCPHDSETVSELLKNVEMALYKSKNAGKSQYRYYESSFQKEVERLIHVESSINKVFQNQAFELFFQPIYHLEDQSIEGFEALLRWKYNTGNINTGEFIEVAEKTGQIIEIDRWVISSAFTFLKEHYSDTAHELSINLSAKSLMSPTLLDFIQDQVKVHQVPPTRIAFEVTEHSLIDNFDLTKSIIVALKEVGFKISLDDFGTRFSSLNYLSKIPFDVLKIDKSYIDSVTEDGKDQVIVKQIITLASSLGLKTVAEGIETQEQREVLTQMGCDSGQGYLLSKPVPLELLLRLTQS